MLASNVTLVGQLDPKRADAGAVLTLTASDFTSEELGAMIAGEPTLGETTGSAAKKGAKRRKA